jgi:hypothetical protein
MAVVSFIRYPINGKLGEPQIRQGRKSSFTPVENQTTIPRSSSPKPSHYTDWALVALPGKEQKFFYFKVSKHPPFQWAPAAFRWKRRTRCGPGTVVGVATGYGLDGPGNESRWGRDFPHLSIPDTGAHPASCTMGTGSFPGVKSGRGVMLTPHPLLVPWSKKGRAIPLLPQWAIRPVQNLSACTKVHFTFWLQNPVRETENTSI